MPVGNREIPLLTAAMFFSCEFIFRHSANLWLFSCQFSKLLGFLTTFFVEPCGATCLNPPKHVGRCGVPSEIHRFPGSDPEFVQGTPPRRGLLCDVSIFLRWVPTNLPLLSFRSQDLSRLPFRVYRETLVRDSQSKHSLFFFVSASIAAVRRQVFFPNILELPAEPGVPFQSQGIDSSISVRRAVYRLSSNCKQHRNISLRLTRRSSIQGPLSLTDFSFHGPPPGFSQGMVPKPYSIVFFPCGRS